MKTLFTPTIILVILLALFEACGDKNLKTITSQTKDNYNIVLLNKEGAIEKGSGKFYLEFHDNAKNQLVDVGNVKVQASMPMPGMPMVNDAEVEVTDNPGRYSVKYNLSMSGSWTLNIQFDGNKSITIPVTVN